MTIGLYALTGPRTGWNSVAIKVVGVVGIDPLVAAITLALTSSIVETAVAQEAGHLGRVARGAVLTVYVDDTTRGDSAADRESKKNGTESFSRVHRDPLLKSLEALGARRAAGLGRQDGANDSAHVESV